MIKILIVLALIASGAILVGCGAWRIFITWCETSFDFEDDVNLEAKDFTPKQAEDTIGGANIKHLPSNQ